MGKFLRKVKKKLLKFWKTKTVWGRVAELEKEVKALKKAKKELGKEVKSLKEANQKLERTIRDQIKNIKESKEERKRRRKEERNREYIQKVVENTGWTAEYAKEAMDKSQELCGAEYKDYVAYRFWELNDKTQATYFTKGHANALRRKYNTNKDNIKCFMDKNRFDEIFENFLGRPWIDTSKMTLEEFKRVFATEERIIYKPLSDSCGHGVTVFELNDEVMESVFKTIASLPAGVAEGYLKQHPEMSKYSRKSVNTIRVVSVKAFGKVNILYAAFRMGGGDAVVDNFHAGGVLALVDLKSGVINTKAIDLAANEYEVHPVTQEKIVDFQIPYWKETVELIENAGMVVDGIGYVGWDVAITENGPVLIEGNTAPAPNVLQTPYAKQHKGMKHVIEQYL